MQVLKHFLYISTRWASTAGVWDQLQLVLKDHYGLFERDQAAQELGRWRDEFAFYSVLLSAASLANRWQHWRACSISGLLTTDWHPLSIVPKLTFDWGDVLLFLHSSKRQPVNDRPHVPGSDFSISNSWPVWIYLTSSFAYFNTHLWGDMMSLPCSWPFSKCCHGNPSLLFVVHQPPRFFGPALSLWSSVFVISPSSAYQKTQQQHVEVRTQDRHSFACFLFINTIWNGDAKIAFYYLEECKNTVSCYLCSLWRGWFIISLLLIQWIVIFVCGKPNQKMHFSPRLQQVSPSHKVHTASHHAGSRPPPFHEATAAHSDSPAQF